MFTFLCTTSLLGSTVILKMTVHVPSMETCFLIPERAWQTLFLKDCVSLSDLRVTWRTDTRSWSLFFLTRASLWQKSGYTDDISQKHWKENNLFLYGAKEKNWKGFFFFFFELGHWEFLYMWGDLESNAHAHSWNHAQKRPWEELKLSSLPDL